MIEMYERIGYKEKAARYIAILGNAGDEKKKVNRAHSTFMEIDR